jgi:hypothetical protein
MTGIRVTELHYKLDLSDNLSYKPDLKLDVELNDFAGTIAPDNCRFKSAKHFESIDAARNSLEPQLLAWRNWTILHRAADWLPFEFVKAVTEPWPPLPPGHVSPMVGHASLIFAAGSLGMHLTGNEFPKPPTAFVVDSCVKVGMVMLRDSIDTKRHALRCANTFFTSIEDFHGGRREAAVALNIEFKTLAELGRLLAVGGLGEDARKLKTVANETRIEFTDQQHAWLIAVFKELISRQGQFAANAVPTNHFSSPRPTV